VQGMLQLKKFAVVVWVRKMDTFKSVREQLVSIAKDEPDESTELEGIVDFHWRFDSHPEAERLANSLRDLLRFNVGHLLRFEAGRRSDLMSATISNVPEGRNG
jgi:hypothetical protein